jgi:glycosyltransferase involved in cell wall biosynthesis
VVESVNVGVGPSAERAAVNRASPLRVSVVIPCRNDAVMLATCLSALARQSRPADEIIVVDNGSEDDSVEVAVRFGARVVRDPRGGIPGATAAGFDAARGEVFARLDADSVPDSDWLERVESAFREFPGLAGVTGTGSFYDAGQVVSWLGGHLYLGGYFWAIGKMLGHPPLFGSNFAITSATWAAISSRVHRVETIHDDLDISYQFRPGMVVLFDPRLVVGVSARPFGSARALGKRLRMAYTTLAVESREESPARRRRDRRDWDATH